MSAPFLLDYAGPQPVAQISLPRRIFRAIAFMVMLMIFLAVVFVRGVLLGVGHACVFTGTVFLLLGGRRSAGVTLKRWRGYWSDHLRLWGSDIMRPLRRARAPRKVVSLLPA